MVDERELLAREVAALLVEDVLDDDRGGVPVGAGEVEDPLEDAPVGGRGAAVAHGVDRDLVLAGARDQLVGDARRERLERERALALERLVALDALVGVVGGLALAELDLHAADAAVALVDEREVVVVAVGEGDAVRRVGPGAVAEHREDEVGIGRRRHRERRRRRDRQSGKFHGFALPGWFVYRPLAGPLVVPRPVSGGRARGAASPSPCARVPRFRAARQSGRR